MTKTKTTLKLSILSAALFAAALAFFWLSGRSFSALKSIADQLSPDHNYKIFTENFYARVVLGLRFLGGGLAGLAVLIFCTRVKLSTFIDRIFVRIRDGYKDFGRDIRFYLKDIFFNASIDGFHWIFLGAIFLVAIIYRGYFLNVRPMSYDEAFNFQYFVSGGFPHILSDYHQPNNHILHTLLVRVSSLAFGITPWALRLPAFIFGILSLFLFYLFGRTFFKSPFTALLGTLLTAVGGAYVHYSVSARGYSLVTFFTLLLIFLARYLLKNENLFAWILFSIVSILGIYTVPTMIYSIANVCLWMALTLFFLKFDSSVRKNNLLIHLSLSFVFIAFFVCLLYSPVFIRAGFKMPEAMIVSQMQSAFHFKDLFVDEYKILKGHGSGFWNFFNWGFGSGLRVLLVLGLAGYSLNYKKATATKTTDWLAVSALVFLLFVLVKRVVPYDRTWTPLIFFYFFASAAGISVLLEKVCAPLKRANQRLLLSILGLFIIWQSAGMVARDHKLIYYDSRVVDFRSIFPFLKKNLTADDKIFIMMSGWDPIVFHYYLKAYGLGEWDDQSFEFSPELVDYLKKAKHYEKSSIYAIFIEKGPECYQYYHCDHVHPIEDVIYNTIDKNAYDPPKRILSFPTGEIDYLRYNGK